MGRALRIDPTGGWHHVMSRGVDRQAIFRSSDDRLLFEDLIGEAVARFGIEVHSYCLMDNHFHLLVHCPNGGLSVAIQWLLSRYATRVNQRLDRVGHLFGSRFTSRLVADDGYLANVVRYIHLNSLDIAGVRHPAEYRWSSHQAYVGRRPRPEWLETRVVMGWFLDRATFDRFVCAPIQERPAGTSAVSHAIGLVEAIDMAIGESHRTKGRRMMALRRAVGLAIADEASSPTRDGIHRALGLTGANSIRAARHRAHALRHADPIVDHLIARVRLLFAEDLSSSRSHAA